MKYLLTILLCFSIISGWAQKVCIIPEGYTIDNSSGKKTVTVCPNTSVSLSAVDCSSPGLLLKSSWSKLHSSTTIAGTSKFVANEEGTYVVNDYTYNTWDTLIIQHQPVMNFSIIYPDPFVRLCENESITINSTSNPALTSYEWLFAGTNTTLSSTSAYTMKDFSPGIYDLVARAEDNGCEVSDTISVAVLATPIVNLGNDTGFCKDSKFLLEVEESPAYTYKWNNGSTNYFLNVTSPGEYSVTVTTAAGCKSSDSINIQEYPLPVLSVSNDTTICPNTSVALKASASSGSGDFNFFWNPATTLNETTKPEVIATPVTAVQQYSVMVMDKNFCRDTGSVRTTWFPSISASVAFSDTSGCHGTPINLSASATGGTPFSASTLAGKYNFSWTPIVNITNENTPTPTVKAQNDTVLYTVKITDAKGCYTEKTVLVKSPDMSVTINEGNQKQVCQGTVVNLTTTVQGGEPGYTYSWSGDETISSTGSATASTTPAGPVSKFTVKVTDNRGCEVSDTIEIKVLSKPLVKADVDYYQICAGDTVRFDAISTSGGSGIYTYQWTGMNLSPNDTVNPLFKSYNTDSGIKLFIVKVEDKFGCAGNTDTVKVELVPLPIVDIGRPDTGICQGETAMLTAKSIHSGLNFEWIRYGDNVILSSTNQLAVTDPATYAVYVTNSFGCPAMDTIRVNHIIPPTSLAINAPDSAANNKAVSLSALTDGEFLTYNWQSEGSGFFSDKAAMYTSYQPTLSDSGYIRFTVSIVGGCADGLKAETTIKLYEEKPVVNTKQIPVVPNVFSPSNPLPQNQTLMVFRTESLEEKDFIFRVYNRWGDVVYETNSLKEASEKGWNGKLGSNGQTLNMDVYTYMVKARFKDGEIFEKTGTATLIR